MSSITQRFRHEFLPGDRRRGERYFRGGRVTEITSGSDGLRATVLGTHLYEVRVSWSDDGIRGLEVVEMSCNCPRFDDAGCCKHLWATLLRAEAEALVPHQLGVDRGQRKLMTPDAAVAPLELPLWERSLERVEKALALRSESDLRRRGRPTRSPSGECLLELHSDLSTCRERGELVIHPHRRRRKKDGDWGKVHSFRASHDRLPDFSQQEDRELLSMLLHACRDPQEEERQRWSPPADWKFGSFVVPPALYSTLLPSICGGGRWFWTSREAPPVLLERFDQRAWRLRLLVAGARPDYELSGVLECEGERRELSDPALLLRSGLVIWPSTIGRLDVTEDDFLWILELRRSGLVSLGEEELERWLERFWSLPLQPAVELPEGWQLEDRRLQPELRLVVEAGPASDYHRSSWGRTWDEVSLEARFGYGEKEVTAADPESVWIDSEQRVRTLRDREAESVAMAELAALELPGRRMSLRQGRLTLPIAENRSLEVLRRLAEQLGGRWRIRFEGRQVRTPRQPMLRLMSQIDWFELEGEVGFGEEVVSLPELLERRKDGAVPLADGSLGLLPDGWTRPLDALSALADLDEDKVLRMLSSQILLLESLVTDRLEAEVELDRRARRLRESLLSFDGIEPRREPRGFRGELRPYQKSGLGWLGFLRDHGLGGCLADDMGLGKTVQVLALIQQPRATRRGDGSESPPRRATLVVAPTSVAPNWIAEAERFAPRLVTLAYFGPSRKEGLASIAQGDLVVTTYGTLRRDAALLGAIPFDTVVLDEAQAIKNPRSQTAGAALGLDAAHRLALTGTPVENHLGELASIFEFLNPGMLGRLPSLRALADHRRAGPSDLMLASRALRPMILRRTKEKVLTELPPKLEQTLYCELSVGERRRYEELLHFYRAKLTERVASVGLQKAKFHVLEALLRLRQASCHQGLVDEGKRSESSAKVDLLLDQLEDVVQSEGHKALVFSQFVTLLGFVRSQLYKRGWQYEFLHGRTRKRQQRIRRFQEDPDCRIFLISLKAGGLGLNLTAADYVFVLDPWWNPAVESQAIDRAHRIGQERPVFAYRIIARGTVEERIAELQESKRALADAILGQDKGVIEQLTVEDLERLLRA